MIGNKFEELNRLLDMWAESDVDMMEEIEELIVKKRNEMGTIPTKILNLEREIQRFNSFKYDQNTQDNILSLLKICNKLNIKYDQDIDLSEPDTEYIITTMYSICEKEWREENDLFDEEMSLDKVMKITKSILGFR